MKISDPSTQKLFSKAFILGGSPCSGKSTIAERLSNEFNLQYYKVDDYERDHSNRSKPDRHPVMHGYSKMSWNEIWMRPVTIQVQEEFEYYRERFEMVVQDLCKYESDEAIILEGAAFLPEILGQNDANPERVLFFIPTKEFQLHHYSQRVWIQEILKDCEEPMRAFENWMRRDHLFGQEILRQADAMNYETITVAGKQSIDEQYDKVKQYFQLE